MTFRSDEVRLIEREYPMFCLWAITRGVLFFPKNIAAEEDEYGKYDLTSKAYLFMKKLHQSYREFMLMDSDERDKIFVMEMKYIEEKAKQAKELESKK